jgi:hypothetical protein
MMCAAAISGTALPLDRNAPQRDSECLATDLERFATNQNGSP